MKIIIYNKEVKNPILKWIIAFITTAILILIVMPIILIISCFTSKFTNQ